MAQVPTIKERLEAAQKRLQSEIDKWNKAGLRFNAWRMGDLELQTRVEVATLIAIVKDKLEMSQEEIDIYYKNEWVRALQEIRPMMQAAQSAEVRRQILDGIRPEI